MLAEIDAARQLADDEEIKSLSDDLGLERRCARQRFPDLGGTEVREESELLAKRQQGPLLGTLRPRERVPLRTAHRAQQHRIGRLAGRKRVVRQAVAERIVCRTTDQFFVERKVVAELLGDFLQHLDGLAHDLWTDTITRNNSNCLFHCQ